MAKQIRRQLHVWISEADHSFLRTYAEQNDTTTGAVVRILIKQLRQRCEGGTGKAPDRFLATPGRHSER